MMSRGQVLEFLGIAERSGGSTYRRAVFPTLGNWDQRIARRIYTRRGWNPAYSRIPTRRQRGSFLSMKSPRHGWRTPRAPTRTQQLHRFSSCNPPEIFSR